MTRSQKKSLVIFTVLFLLSVAALVIGLDAKDGALTGWSAIAVVGTLCVGVMLHLLLGPTKQG